MIDQVCSGLDHPSGTAGGAETAAFARKRDQVFETAGITLDAQEPMREQAALQEVVERLFDELR